MAAEKRPASVTIMGKRYTITYVDSPSEVDIFKRQSCWGQIDYWTRSIRVFERDLSDEDVWETIVHEVIHGLAEALALTQMKKDENHEELGLLALGLTDTFFRNGWITFDDSEGKHAQNRTRKQ